MASCWTPAALISARLRIVSGDPFGQGRHLQQRRFVGRLE